MEYVSDKHGITQHVEFNKKVESMHWNKTTHQWDVKLNNGEVNEMASLKMCNLGRNR